MFVCVCVCVCASAGVKDLTSRKRNGCKRNLGWREVAWGEDGKMKVGRPNHFLPQCPSAMEDPKLAIRMSLLLPTPLPPLPAFKHGVKIRTSESLNGCVSHLRENPNTAGRKTAAVQAVNGRLPFDAGKATTKHSRRESVGGRTSPAIPRYTPVTPWHCNFLLIKRPAVSSLSAHPHRVCV